MDVPSTTSRPSSTSQMTYSSLLVSRPPGTVILRDDTFILGEGGEMTPVPAGTIAVPIDSDEDSSNDASSSAVVPEAAEAPSDSALPAVSASVAAAPPGPGGDTQSPSVDEDVARKQSAADRETSSTVESLPLLAEDSNGLPGPVNDTPATLGVTPANDLYVQEEEEVLQDNALVANPTAAEAELSSSVAAMDSRSMEVSDVATTSEKAPKKKKVKHTDHIVEKSPAKAASPENLDEKPEITLVEKVASKRAEKSTGKTSQVDAPSVTAPPIPAVTATPAVSASGRPQRNTPRRSTYEMLHGAELKPAPPRRGAASNSDHETEPAKPPPAKKAKAGSKLAPSENLATEDPTGKVAEEPPQHHGKGRGRPGRTSATSATASLSSDSIDTAASVSAETIGYELESPAVSAPPDPTSGENVEPKTTAIEPAVESPEKSKQDESPEVKMEEGVPSPKHELTSDLEQPDLKPEVSEKMDDGDGPAAESVSQSAEPAEAVEEDVSEGQKEMEISKDDVKEESPEIATPQPDDEKLAPRKRGRPPKKLVSPNDEPDASAESPAPDEGTKRRRKKASDPENDANEDKTGKESPAPDEASIRKRRKKLETEVAVKSPIKSQTCSAGKDDLSAVGKGTETCRGPGFPYAAFTLGELHGGLDVNDPNSGKSLETGDRNTVTPFDRGTSSASGWMQEKIKQLEAEVSGLQETIQEAKKRERVWQESNKHSRLWQQIVSEVGSDIADEKLVNARIQQKLRALDHELDERESGLKIREGRIARRERRILEKERVIRQREKELEIRLRQMGEVVKTGGNTNGGSGAASAKDSTAGSAASVRPGRGSLLNKEMHLELREYELDRQKIFIEDERKKLVVKERELATREQALVGTGSNLTTAAAAVELEASSPVVTQDIPETRTNGKVVAEFSDDENDEEFGGGGNLDKFPVIGSTAAGKSFSLGNFDRAFDDSDDDDDAKVDNKLQFSLGGNTKSDHVSDPASGSSVTVETTKTALVGKKPQLIVNDFDDSDEDADRPLAPVAPNTAS